MVGGVAIGLALAIAAPAQRARASFTLRDLESVIEYGVPRLRKHSLDELASGVEWRLGSNAPTTWSTGMPILAGDDVVPPGHFRIKLKREGEGFRLRVEGTGVAGGGKATSSWLPGELGEADEIDRLDLRFDDLRQSETKDDPNPVGCLALRFGSHRLRVPFTVIAPSTPRKVPGGVVYGFAMPAAVVAARLQGDQPTAIAAFHRRRPGKDEPSFFNLVIDRQRACLLPAAVAPAGADGFGPVQPLAAAWSSEGELTWGSESSGGGTPPPVPFLKLLAVEMAKKQLRVQFACGDRLGTVNIALPEKRE